MMPQRREKNDKSGHQDAFLGLLTLLESPDPETVDSVKNMIQEDLRGSKDSRLVNNLVDFYVATQSKSSFEILLHLRDPHDKHLFEKINEMLKTETTRYNALQLLGNIVYKQPTWLYKIANQRVMYTLLEILKTDQNCPNLLSGLFILICLLPMIPHLFGSLLRDTFDIFSRLAAWNVKKPSSLSDILNLHLQTGIYSLFHRLYGMFPCNFLAYLRSFYGGRDNSGDNVKVFGLVIKPMLERVRLHPLLVTASKETELNVNRWKRMAYHDIIVECASISLDTIEGTFENYRKMDSSTSSHSEKVSSYESANSVNFCQNNTPISMDIGSNMIDSALSNQDHMWSPIQSCSAVALSYSSSLSSPTTTKGEWEFKNVMQSSTEESIPLDFAVEAKPELLKSEISEQTSKGKQMFSHNSTELDVNIIKKSLPNDAKEDDIDREVSELTSADALEQSLTSVDVRHDTPFCSTTQTLTDEPANLIQSEGLTTRNDDDEEVDEMYNSMQEPDLQPYVSPLTRYRYFSHCGPPPDLECIMKKPKVFRSISCPPVLNSEQGLVLTESSDDKNANESEIVGCSGNNITSTTASAFSPLNGEKSLMSKEILPIFQQLLPSIVNPLQGFEQPIIIGFANIQKQNSKILSPPELLDQYIQQSGTAYLTHLPLTSKSNTDWTHFGGKPPPEEIEILRNQILLLHNMLLFERHRKDIHSERNRRILGRAKRNRMNEEYLNALKTEIVKLMEENANLKKELSNQYKMYQLLQDQKKLMKEDFDSKLFKTCQENAQLLFSNKQMQTLLVSQKEENDEIRELYKKAQCDVAAGRCQLKYAKQEMQQCQKFKKEAIFLTKQVIMLQELNSQYKNKIEYTKKPQLKIESELLNDSMAAEIKELKQKLENESLSLDSAKRRISELENILSDMKLQQKEKVNLHETMKAFHQAEIMAYEDRLGDLKKISLEKDAHILKLYSDLDGLKEEINSFERKMQQNVNDQCSNNGHQPQNSTGCDKSFVEKEALS